MKLEMKDDALYDGAALLGEFEAGQFVPSRLLLRRPAADHRAVDEFVKGLAFAISYSRQGKRAAKRRLEYIRGELRAERISTGELIELQSLAMYIDADDVELLEPAGVPEF